MPVLVAAGGGAVAYGKALNARVQLQGSLDGAVLAGARLDGSLDEKIAAARAILEGDLATAGVDFTYTAQFSQDGDVLRGAATAQVPNPFPLPIAGDRIEVGVRAAARRSEAPVCILGLNNLDNGAFDINGAPSFNAPNCAVQANSGHTRAMTMEGSPQAKAARFAVHGGHTGDHYVPEPVDQSARVADPYANLPFPETDPCEGAKGGLTLNESTTLSPGTYCGGVTVTGGSDVVITLKPGVYVMSGGSLHLKGQVRMVGREVLLAFTGDDATLRLWGGSELDVTSPATGTYANMQFMQDRADQAGRGMWVSIGGGAQDTAKLKYEGVAYFPTQNFWIYGSSTMDAVAPGLAVVADKVWVQGAAKVDIVTRNDRNLPVVSPKQFIRVALVQ